jgi:predicted DNA-binding protein with PD1-like motif
MARLIVHPGPPAAERVRVAEAGVQPLRLRLKEGRTVNEAVAAAFAEAGFESGYVDFAGLTLDPVRYVIPAASPDAAHAAWYSHTYAPSGVASIEKAGAIVGRRDGMPFLHCHGIWRLADGTRRMGHLLPFEAVVAEEIEIDAWAISGAWFEAQDDPETNFRLFAPVVETARRAPAPTPGLLCTICPNEDLATRIAQVCRAYGLESASVYGIGSLVGCAFADGTGMDSYATEVLVTAGTVRNEAVSLDIAIVGMDGAIAEGRLAGVNTVCVTFELLIVGERSASP